ncbi:type IV toxin-antitoxin system AbiEi family antitoxin [Mycolicibacterium thermoresistibile]|uniref:AbiEi antitoxin C-terminal domain-containing protein n=2 Tax=Mycolicibacterium thermoresistibile TaxID=1797 RepID=G7CGV3_MYCT3|nr:type IV toxin-antitoxin system AbiEi family antitoxin [Mycolicibacterium thermoresistibile]EHI12063.1 hypothetical protein KEK_14228 [Mycolicibacterium thermoresistibile ATCC 19527]MCV7188860.1 hypothetical protein [Mycolicibacterium thermoresistibile]GAT14957.1 hypothetical protein RMCT_1927 [Mycolicibacterium thermoresistibile]SNW20179.1 cullin, a subunit of E3 ubiquitin ligase [Mycolicibacterium thermoresistibile]
MGHPFIGSAALAAGQLTSHALRSRFVAVYRDVYVPRGTEITAEVRARSAWLWSRRRGVVAGQSAAALHGAKWVDPRRPAELLWPNRRPPDGIRTWSDRVTDLEIDVVDGVPVTTPARTALDLACRYPQDRAVAAIDALANATRLKLADIELIAERFRGRRGIRDARAVLDLVDPGAESPRETRLRLLVMRHGFPRPQTQIPIHDEYGRLVAVVDLGWEDLKIAMDYDGHHHRDPDRFNRDIRRHDEITELGWTHLRVTSRDTDGGVIRQLQTVWARRT